MHVAAIQDFVYSERETQEPISSAIRWTGDFKRVKDRWDPQLHAVVRVNQTTSNACVIDGIIKVSKTRQVPTTQ
jgi:hypothetical protein